MPNSTNFEIFSGALDGEDSLCPSGTLAAANCAEAWMAYLYNNLRQVVQVARTVFETTLDGDGPVTALKRCAPADKVAGYVEDALTQFQGSPVGNATCVVDTRPWTSAYYRVEFGPVSQEFCNAARDSVKLSLEDDCYTAKTLFIQAGAIAGMAIGAAALVALAYCLCKARRNGCPAAVAQTLAAVKGVLGNCCEALMDCCSSTPRPVFRQPAARAAQPAARPAAAVALASASRPVAASGQLSVFGSSSSAAATNPPGGPTVYSH